MVPILPGPAPGLRASASYALRCKRTGIRRESTVARTTIGSWPRFSPAERWAPWPARPEHPRRPPTRRAGHGRRSPSTSSAPSWWVISPPDSGAVAAVELPAPPARHRIVRRVNHVLDDAGRDAEDDRARPLGPGRRLHRRQHRAGIAGGLPGHRFGSPGAGALMTARGRRSWSGPASCSSAASESVLRFVVDRAVARRAARSFPFGTLAVNISGAALLGLLGGLALSKDAALLAGTAFVGAYTTFSTWMLETQRLGEERQCGRRSPTSSSASCSVWPRRCSGNGSRGACEPALPEVDRLLRRTPTRSRRRRGFWPTRCWICSAPRRRDQRDAARHREFRAAP